MDHSEYSGCEDCFPCERPPKGITANELDKTMYSVDVSQLLFFFFYLNKFLFIYLFFIYFYQLEANYFTVLQWFFSYIDMNQPVSQLLSPASVGLVQLAYEKLTVGGAGGVLMVQQYGLCLNKTDQTYAIAECLICQQQVQH